VVGYGYIYDIIFIIQFLKSNINYLWPNSRPHPPPPPPMKNSGCTPITHPSNSFETTVWNNVISSNMEWPSVWYNRQTSKLSSLIFSIVYFPCSCFTHTDWFVTNYCILVLHLLRVSADTIQPSSCVLYTADDYNWWIYIYIYINIYLPLNDKLHAAAVCTKEFSLMMAE
jgi:hypothetical protein